MLAQLAAVSRDIQRTLMADDFTAGILPEPLKDGVLAYPSRGGKGLRPALLLWCCGVFDANLDRALRVAAAVEIYHIWTLVHDDIIDNDDLRRGEPSVHELVRRSALNDNGTMPAETAKELGVNFAILAGDIQQGWSNQLILSGVDDGLPGDVAITILRRLNGVVNPGLISGEALDVAFEQLPFAAISSTDILGMLTLKTGLLLRFAAESGAMIGLGVDDPGNSTVRRLGDMAEKAGVAFQIRDDLIGMFGDEGQLGKPVGSDLEQGKRTLLIISALERLEGTDRAFLQAQIGKAGIADDDFRRVQRLLRECGVVADLETRIDTMIGEAAAAIGELPDNDYRTLLEQWLRFVADWTRYEE